jgi:hypothetical protein
MCRNAFSSERIAHFMAQWLIEVFEVGPGGGLLFPILIVVVNRDRDGALYHVECDLIGELYDAA